MLSIARKQYDTKLHWPPLVIVIAENRLKKIAPLALM